MNNPVVVNVPKNGARLMWNGFVSPYSSTGHDWMDDAVHVISQNHVTEELQELVDEFMFLSRQLHSDIDGYDKYIRSEIKKVKGRLGKLGFVVKIS